MVDNDGTALKRRFFVRWRGRISGPFDGTHLLELLRSGQISKHHQISEDRNHWISLAEHEDLGAECGRGSVTEKKASSKADSKDRPRLHFRDEPSTNHGGADNRWYYVDNETTAGPVDLEQIRAMVASGQLPKGVPLCKEGENIWQHATEVLTPQIPGPTGYPGTQRATEPVNAEQNILAANERVCLSCGRIHRTAGAYCQHCGHPLDQMRKAYGGIGRLGYLGLSFALGLLQFVLSMAVGSTEGEGFLIVVFIGLQLVPIVLRLKNIGSSAWWSLLTFVPIVNIALGVWCLAYPEGYEDSKELDTAGKVVVGILVGSFILALFFVLIAAIMSS